MSFAPSRMEFFIKSYFETALNVIATVVALLVFVPYFKQRKSTNFVGTLLFYAATCIFYSFMHAFYNGSRLLGAHGVNLRFLEKNTAADRMIYSILSLSTNFLFISGPALALDRFFVMAAPIRYAHFKLSDKFCVLAGALCLATGLTIAVSLVSLPYESRTSELSTEAVRKVIIVIFDSAIFVECVLHIAFCVQFHRFQKRQRNFAKQHVIRANHITLFLILSQTVFCLIPKILFHGRKLFTNEMPMWILQIVLYYSFLLTLHVLLTCSFVLFTLRRKHRQTRIASIAQNSNSNSFRVSTSK